MGQEAITCEKTVDPGTVTLAVIDAGVLSLSCYGLRNPSCPSAVSCFLGRSTFLHRLRPNLRMFVVMPVSFFPSRKPWLELTMFRNP